MLETTGDSLRIDLTSTRTQSDLGTALRDLRKSSSLSTWDLDRQTRRQDVRLTRSTISRVERGEKLPTLRWLRVFLELCGIEAGTRH